MAANGARIKPIADRDWLTTFEVADQAEVTRQTVVSWMTAGVPVSRGVGTVRCRLPYTKIGRRYRISKTDLARFFDAMRSPGGDHVPPESAAEYRRRVEDDDRLAAAYLGG